MQRSFGRRECDLGDIPCKEEIWEMRQGGRWVSNHAEICWPYKEACIFKIPLKDGKQVEVKWLDFHCNSFEKRNLD